MNKLRTISSLYRRTFANHTKYKEPPYPRKIFSGIQPTGTMHLGNYLGAVRQWTKLQENNEDITLCIVDLHSITLPQDPQRLSKNVLEMTATLLACGIDVDKTILFQQSTVPQHVELCWQLGCISTMARLAHLPQYKEKSANLKDVPLGLFIYPVLQAADILLHKATHVPVGEDQVQHLYLAQELARMFNTRFGHTFPTPHAILLDAGSARVKSLRDPSKKMSKSDTDTKSCIYLTDSNDQIRNKFKKAVTDFTSTVSYNIEERLGVSNLINIHSAVTGKSAEDICEEVTHLNTGQYKLLVADVVMEHIAPIREKLEALLSEKQYLLEILNTGQMKASEIASKTIDETKTKLGLSNKIVNEVKRESIV